jgi:hypothetical protein
MLLIEPLPAQVTDQPKSLFVTGQGIPLGCQCKSMLCQHQRKQVAGALEDCLHLLPQGWVHAGAARRVGDGEANGVYNDAVPEAGAPMPFWLSFHDKAIVSFKRRFDWNIALHECGVSTSNQATESS